MLLADRILLSLLRLHNKVDYALTKIGRIQRELKMADEKIAALEAEIAENTTVVGSVETLVTNLVAELTLAKGNDERIQAVIDKLDADGKRLALLVTANTPVDEGEPPPPPVEPTTP